MRIILASASPRRKDLLHQIGFQFEVIPAKGEEVITKQVPSEIVMELAQQKAEEVAQNMERNDDITSSDPLMVIGADTIVVKDDKILGKPRDKAHAIEMLRSLQGSTHEVYTGVSMIFIRNKKREIHTFYESTEVIFYNMTEEEILEYVESKEPMDKAGAYGIQGLCAKYIKGIRGDYQNVVGLPVARVYQEYRCYCSGLAQTVI